MKYIKFKRQIPAVVQDMPDGSKDVIKEEYFQDRGIYFTDDDKEIQIAEALKIAYNGEYTIEDDGIELTVEQQIAELKAQLASTDYKAIKYAEGWITEEEYAPIRAERQALRDKINELEGGIS